MAGVWTRGGREHTWGENTALFWFPLACQALCFLCWILFNSSSWLQFSSVLGKEQKLSSPRLLFMFKRGKSFIKMKRISNNEHTFESLEVLLYLRARGRFQRISNHEVVFGVFP